MTWFATGAAAAGAVSSFLGTSSAKKAQEKAAQQAAAAVVVVYVRKSIDDQSLQAASVVGPESLQRQFPVSHPELIAEDVEIHLL